MRFDCFPIVLNLHFAEMRGSRSVATQKMKSFKLKLLAVCVSKFLNLFLPLKFKAKVDEDLACLFTVAI